MEKDMTDAADDARDRVAEVAAAYFSNSHVGIGDIQKVIDEIAAGLSRVGQTAEPAVAAPEERATEETRATPAQVRKSVTPDVLISFEDGKRYKSLRRHLSIRGLTPEQYREKWGLPRDYPMVSPNYSAQRSALAKSYGLGSVGRGRSAAAAAPAPGAKRGRKPKTA
jgi:predicted transcriptional regulator